MRAVVRRHHLAVPAAALGPVPGRLVAAQPAAAAVGHVVGRAGLLLLHGEVVAAPDDDHAPRGARVRVPAHAVVDGLGLPRRHPPLQPAPPHVELRLLRPRRALLRPAAAPQLAWIVVARSIQVYHCSHQLLNNYLLREGVGERPLAPRGGLDPALHPLPRHVGAHRAVVPLLLTPHHIVHQQWQIKAV
jgi:hypothetical protein